VVEITIPSLLSQHIVSKSITKNNKMKVPIIGLIENMAGYTCPHCEKEGPLFEGDDVESLAKKKNIPYLGKVPFDTRIGRKTDSGSLYYMDNKNSITGKAISSIVDKILKSI
jgi:ATP-binding protein involved in chromosome partitioning